MDWNESIEHTLDMIRLNCVSLSEHHKDLHSTYKYRTNFSRTPILILTFANAYVAAGLHRYVEQNKISDINAAVSLFIGFLIIVQSLMKYQTKMENELLRFKEYYILSASIYSVLMKKRDDRKVNGKYFLEEKFSKYEELVMHSDIINKYSSDLFQQPSKMTTDTPSGEQVNGNMTQKLFDHWNILFQPKLTKLKQENIGILQKLQRNFSSEPVSQNETIDDIPEEKVDVEMGSPIGTIPAVPVLQQTESDINSVTQTKTEEPTKPKETEEPTKTKETEETSTLSTLYNSFSYDIFNTGHLKEQMQKDQIELTKMRNLVNEELKRNKSTKSSMGMSMSFR